MHDAFDAALDALAEAGDDEAALCQPFIDVLRVTGASVASLGPPLGSETVAASDPLALRLDELQFDLGEGPCWDALATGRPVIEPDVRESVHGHWPAFSRAIQHDDVGALFAFPLHVGPLRLGAVDLYSGDPRSLNAAEQRQAGAMSGVVGRSVLRRALERASDDGQVDLAPHSRRLVHQATGVVLAQLGTSPEDAQLIIQAHAFASARSVGEVADDILGGRLSFSTSADGIEDHP
ncbi:ANTAR domain-containing protein [Frondihabitans sp. PhB188]|uniref:GAF and ANTAR domain-containing protein n=1 Tax=Frondihabitans sp. PhB188 TaxID=2485200 RepID=UPI000F486A4A|nr:GAF and ANTAR domain-containing protein [Frondihabitans sp. PhB188]ROQ40132.1 ANTAR domain-containing protein [Frondihabitans sp. PhB188]